MINHPQTNVVGRINIIQVDWLVLYNNFFGYVQDLVKARSSTLKTMEYNILLPVVNNESSEVIDILLPVTFYFNPSTRLHNVKNF